MILLLNVIVSRAPSGLPCIASQIMPESLYGTKARIKGPNCVFLQKEADTMKTVSPTQLVQAS